MAARVTRTSVLCGMRCIRILQSPSRLIWSSMRTRRWNGTMSFGVCVRAMFIQFPMAQRMMAIWCLAVYGLWHPLEAPPCSSSQFKKITSSRFRSSNSIAMCLLGPAALAATQRCSLYEQSLILLYQNPRAAASFLPDADGRRLFLVYRQRAVTASLPGRRRQSLLLPHTSG